MPRKAKGVLGTTARGGRPKVLNPVSMDQLHGVCKELNMEPARLFAVMVQDLHNRMTNRGYSDTSMWVRSLEQRCAVLGTDHWNKSDG